jgi:energy-coupling factor transporter ATPase
MADDTFIRVIGARYTYGEGPAPAVSDLDLSVGSGEYVALMGANGSGKSTLLRLLDGLLLPQSGRVTVGGFDTADAPSMRDIRRQVGFVFQNPDAQLVATTVEEDAAFGPENLGVDPGEIRERVDRSLRQVGLDRLVNRPTHLLSVGQKQLLAFASVLAMEPRCILLDEATAFLDPAARNMILDLLDILNHGGTTMLSATHEAREAVRARRVIVLARGRVIADGAPASLFTNDRLLREAGLEPPAPLALFRLLAPGGGEPSAPALDEESLLGWIRNRLPAGSREEKGESP